MSPLGGALKVLLGLTLAWAWWTGRLGRLTDKASGLLGSAAASGASAQGSGAAVGLIPLAPPANPGGSLPT